jgi:hypothetical protein
MSEDWDVRFSEVAKKQYKKLHFCGQKKPSIIDLVDLLMLDLKTKGPERKDWHNYSKLSDDTYHCHLKKGRPTYVACWKVFSKELRRIQVYYVGTHEGAPY